MSDFATLTKEATSLPYEKQLTLLNYLSASIKDIEKWSTHKRTHEENFALVKSFMGISDCWKDVDILEYQRQLRGEYNEYC